MRVFAYVITVVLGGCGDVVGPDLADLSTGDDRRLGEMQPDLSSDMDTAQVDLANRPDLANQLDFAQSQPDLVQLPPDIAGCMPLETACTPMPNVGNMVSFGGPPNASPFCCSGWCFYVERFSTPTPECCIPPGGACTTASDCCRNPSSFTGVVACLGGQCVFQ